MLTVICHFFNEEYLLPWWLGHHRRIFDHGIMIDYKSTDRSCEIIKSMCPTWEIHPSRNPFFDSAEIDREVEDYERGCDSWRVALNVTEFLYGNVDKLRTSARKIQHFIGNYVFVDDMNSGIPTYCKPLHEFARLGYYENNFNSVELLHFGARACRSLHNFAIDYPVQGGRHFREIPTVNDIAIFYYGFAILNEQSIARKLQIKTKMSPEELAVRGTEHPNTVNREQYLNNINVYHRSRCIDLTPEINRLSAYQDYPPISIPPHLKRPIISLRMTMPFAFRKRMKMAIGPFWWEVLMKPIRPVRNVYRRFRS